MNILFIGPLWEGSTSKQRLTTFETIGHHVLGVDTSNPVLNYLMSLIYRACFCLGFAWDITGANKLISENIQKNAFDVVWIEKGLTITSSTLKQIKDVQPYSCLISYCIDDMMLSANQSRNYIRGIPFYDVHLTTKTFNVAELQALGARDVKFFANTYDANAYHPIELSKIEKELWNSDVAFLGGYEKQRYEMMLALANNGVIINVWGPGWEPYINKHPNLIVKPGWVLAEDAAKVFCATKINLHFLRKVARDLQTTRSVEIPACRGFMLAERTQEHLDLFDEGSEAEFFDDIDELLAKIKHYLLHSEQRKTIANAGYERCVKSGYSNYDRLNEILDVIVGKHYPKN